MNSSENILLAPLYNLDFEDFKKSLSDISVQDRKKILKTIEEDMGREQNFRYGPRIIDLDIIFFNNQIVSQENLQIPHHDWQNRKFVIEPLYEILNKELVEEEFNISGQKVEVVGTI